ncbi:hypothetical protein ACGFNU_05720 [Spirillospora sp. NPDC048911]|uniref:hypothetical protein n=1 Tax=Spirillospora sp. NPDC048911 TaxID=3364527 RepID=UPI0037220EA4
MPVEWSRHPMWTQAGWRPGRHRKPRTVAQIYTTVASWQLLTESGDDLTLAQHPPLPPSWATDHTAKHASRTTALASSPRHRKR